MGGGGGVVPYILYYKRRAYIFSTPLYPVLILDTALKLEPCLYFFNQYIHTEQEEIHARYYARSIDFHQDRANNRDCAYNVSKGAHSVLVLETVLVMETCAYNREYTVLGRTAMISLPFCARACMLYRSPWDCMHACELAV